MDRREFFKKAKESALEKVKEAAAKKSRRASIQATTGISEPVQQAIEHAGDYILKGDELQSRRVFLDKARKRATETITGQLSRRALEDSRKLLEGIDFVKRYLPFSYGYNYSTFSFVKHRLDKTRYIH